MMLVINMLQGLHFQMGRMENCLLLTGSRTGQAKTRPDDMLSSHAGAQRGWSKQKDQYVIAEIGISFNIGTYRCPTAY